MKKRKLKFKYKDKTFSINTLECNALEKIRGLMLRNRKKARALLFEFQSSAPAIHSYFVFFPFVAVWLDKDNKVIEIKRIRPFTLRVYPKKPYGKLIEIPINNRYRKIISRLGFWKKK